MTKAEIKQVYSLVGQLVRQHRKRERLTQEQLGQRVGLSRTSITNLERGRQHVPLHILFGIAASLHVKVEALIPPATVIDVPPEVAKALEGRDASVREWATRVILHQVRP